MMKERRKQWYQRRVRDLERLKSNEWLDGATRVVTLEYGLFSPNEDSFMMVIVLFDFSTVGAAQPEISITTTPRTFEQRSTGSIFELMNYALIIWIGFFLLHIIIRLGILFNNSYFLHNHLRKEEQLYYTHLKNEILQKISSRSSGPESEEDEPKIQQIRKMCDTRRIMRATWCATESSKIDSKRSLWDALKNHTLKPYFSNAWNAIESLLIISTSSFLYYAWSPPIDRPLNPINTTVAELWDSYFYVQLAIFCGSISVIFTWFKFTHYMTIMHDSFGVLILSLGAMLADICYFFLLLTVIITGYSTALDIIYAGIDDRWSSFTFAFLNNLLTALGQTQEAESNSMYPWGMNFSLVAGDIIISIYLLTTGITLINLLIALLTATYEKVAEQSTACWRMSKAQKLLFYERFPLAPGPLIIRDLLHILYWQTDVGNVPFDVTYNQAFKKLDSHRKQSPEVASVVKFRDELLETSGKLMKGIWPRNYCFMKDFLLHLVL
eukprot:TRINITY_DN3447_c0_g2_i7.p1 TRINITY_DN3447_c0_g2~~TRINITY_DN3447_c0_g2_i7.p1  ORF type:complete len:496 (-),score=101.39 TRINITY_DN3447_c0_g2_i7:668-2155(-)